MTETFGASMPDELIETIDDNAFRLGYRNRSDFLRGAAKRELERNDVRIEGLEE